MASHAITRRPSHLSALWSSRRGRLTIITTALLLMAGLVAAAAAYFSTAQIGGGASAKSFTLAWKSDAIRTGYGVSTASPTITSGKLNLPTGLAFWPGDTYTFTTKVEANGANGVINGLTMPGLPVGWTAELTEGCGVTVKDTNTNMGYSTPVTVKITATADAAPDGKSWVLKPGAGVLASPADQAGSVTTCPAYIGTGN